MPTDTFDPKVIAEANKARSLANQDEWYAEDPHDSSCGFPCTPDGCHESHPSGTFEVIGPQTEDAYGLHPRFTNEWDAKAIVFCHNAYPHLVAALRAASLALKDEWHDSKCEWRDDNDWHDCNSRLLAKIEEALG